MTTRARAEAEGGDGEAGEGEVGGDTELQGPHGRREDDVQPPDRLRRQVHAGDGGRVRLKKITVGVSLRVLRVAIVSCVYVHARLISMR